MPSLVLAVVKSHSKRGFFYLKTIIFPTDQMKRKNSGRRRNAIRFTGFGVVWMRAANTFVQWGKDERNSRRRTEYE